MANPYETNLALDVAQEFATLTLNLDNNIEKVQELSEEIEAITPDNVTPVDIENLKKLALMTMKLLAMSMLINPEIDGLVAQMPLEPFTKE